MHGHSGAILHIGRRASRAGKLGRVCQYLLGTVALVVAWGASPILLGQSPPPSPSPLPAGGPPAAAPASGKLPIPDAATRAKADALIRANYAADFAKRGPADREALAKKLLHLAEQTGDDPTGRYVLLILAHDLANAAPTALSAAEALSAYFQVNGLSLKSDTITRFATRSTDPPAQIAIANAAQRTVDEAMVAEEWPTARRLLAIARTAARASRDPQLTAKLQSWATETQDALAGLDRIQPSIAKLRTAPDDREANNSVGRFYCFTLGNWDKGLLYLLRGGDLALASAAREDIAARNIPDAPERAPMLAKIGNAWWAAADASTVPTIKERLRQRAADHYRRALGSATGLEKSLMEQRLAEMDRSNHTSNVAGAAVASASHCYGPDTIVAMNDGRLPSSSADLSIPRFTWWDHRGGVEWVQYEFKQPQNIAVVEVYWFQDTAGPGGCQVPKSWRMVYKDGDKWKPVVSQTEYGTKINVFNRVMFRAITTTSVRLEVQLKDGASGGILEWKVQ